MNQDLASRKIKDIAKKLGFETCGISKARKLDDDARRLEAWLSKGFHAGMGYMENHFDLRIDPTLLVPGAHSVIVLVKNYYPSEIPVNNAPKVARYAYGFDYHEVVREKLKSFLYLLRESFGDVAGRGFVDSAPVLERSWAVRSGLGWIGKNANLITRSGGSFFFLATLVTDLELAYDDGFAKDYCGSCTRCIDACPTDAILINRSIDSNRCISYHTIENKSDAMPENLVGQFADWLFGCDICQNVCPWNRFSKPNEEILFRPLPGLLGMGHEEWERLDPEMFATLFRKSPIKRAKLAGIKRNLAFLRRKAGS